MSTPGQRLHNARFAKGYKLRTVGEMVRISASTLSRAERDVMSLTIDDLSKLAAVYGVSISSLIGREYIVEDRVAMTGQLRILVEIMRIFAKDLGRPVRGQAERDTALILGALEGAIQMEATAELARVVKLWCDRKLAAGVQALAADDQSREDAITSLLQVAERTFPQGSGQGEAQSP